MGNPANLAYSSAFNYQKIAVQDTITVTVPAFITLTPTVLATIPSTLSSVDVWRVFSDISGEVQELTYNQLDAALYSYTNGTNLIIACDNSGTGFDFTLYYRIYYPETVI